MRIILHLATFTAMLVATGCGPSASKEGEKWSHKEMIEHLQGKGHKFEAKETQFGTFFGPAMDFEFEGDTVYVQLRRTAQEAKDEASPKGDKAFSWGRFFFKGEQARLAQIKKALP